MLWPLFNCLEVGGGGEYLTSISADWRSASETDAFGWSGHLLLTTSDYRAEGETGQSHLVSHITHVGLLLKTRTLIYRRISSIYSVIKKSAIYLVEALLLFSVQDLFFRIYLKQLKCSTAE